MAGREEALRAAPRPGKAPCKSCPYRKDVPSGVWAAEEYEKLLSYDGETWEQLEGIRLFMCHQQDGNLCAGWIGCHGAEQLLALRLHPVHPDTFSFKSPVPLFSSGAEAAEHGMRDIDDLSEEAERVIQKLDAKRKAKTRT